jgi:hypothetical protein
MQELSVSHCFKRGGVFSGFLDELLDTRHEQA